MFPSIEDSMTPTGHRTRASSSVEDRLLGGGGGQEAVQWVRHCRQVSDAGAGPSFSPGCSSPVLAGRCRSPTDVVSSPSLSASCCGVAVSTYCPDLLLRCVGRRCVSTLTHPRSHSVSLSVCIGTEQMNY